MKDLLDAAKRACTLLDATKRFMEANPIAAEYMIHYDEADCDGQCLADDCGFALEELGTQIMKAEEE